MIPRRKLTFPRNWSCRLPPHTNELNEEENPPSNQRVREVKRHRGRRREKRDGLNKQINACESNYGEKRRKASNTKTMGFWSVAMMAACCKEIKAGSVKWLKSAGAAWVFTFFFLSIPKRMSRERKSEQCGQSTSARYLFHLWQHPRGDWAIVNLEWNISKGCWSRAGAGLLGWVQAVFRRDETHLVPSLSSD